MGGPDSDDLQPLPVIPEGIRAEVETGELLNTAVLHHRINPDKSVSFGQSRGK